MAAVSETSGTKRVWNSGNKRWVKADITSVDTNDTWVSGLEVIEGVIFTPTTAASVGITVSEGTVTFAAASAATVAGQIMVFGV